MQYDMTIKNQMQCFIIPQVSLRYKKRQITFNYDQRAIPYELISPQSEKVMKQEPLKI